MESKQDYIASVQAAIQDLHHCGAQWVSTVPIHEVFEGQTVWNGEVEVFDLTAHAKAKRAYGWSRRDGIGDKDERFVTVLEIPPVVSPETAVKAAIMAKFQKP
jgi:hypothetical protein